MSEIERNSEVFHPEDLIDILPIYYNRLFPTEPFIKWLTQGQGKHKSAWYIPTLAAWHGYSFGVNLYLPVCMYRHRPGASRVLVHSGGRLVSPLPLVQRRRRVQGRAQEKKAHQDRHWRCVCQQVCIQEQYMSL